MKKKYLVAAKNTDGRICCWAQSEDLDAAKKSVDERWPTHGGSGNGCYPGEERAPDEVHLINEDGSVTPYACAHENSEVTSSGMDPDWRKCNDCGAFWKPTAEKLPRPRSRNENAEERAGRERAEEDRFDYLKDEGLLPRR